MYQEGNAQKVPPVRPIRKRNTCKPRPSPLCLQKLPRRESVGVSATGQ